MTDKRIYQIGLTMIEGVGDVLARHLLEVLGDAEAVFVEKPHLLEKVPGIGKTIATKERRDKALSLAEKELAFVEKNHIALYFLTDADYPKRLFECPDAPVLFYFKGNADLNAARVISVVGTRRATAYGQEQTEHLLNELSRSFPDLLVVSGLAYGIDICAHRSALKCQLPTVGVLAHGLDRIYPPVHRATAVEMLAHGGLLTDFPMDTNPDRQNFVRRNRIVAGLADAIIVVESAEKGGSLITADLALSYGRDIFTFPGRVTDPRSKGCNALIRQNKAGLITCAEDLILSMRCPPQEWRRTMEHKYTTYRTFRTRHPHPKMDTAYHPCRNSFPGTMSRRLRNGGSCSNGSTHTGVTKPASCPHWMPDNCWKA